MDDCTRQPIKIECLQGDSIYLLSDLEPETQYYCLIGEIALVRRAGAFLQVSNADCKYVGAGFLFYDEDDDGILDDGEPTLSNLKLEHSKSERYVISDASGYYKTRYTPSFDTLTLAEGSDCWVFRNSEDGILSANGGLLQNRNIPLLATGNNSVGTEIFINTGRSRCNEKAKIWVNVKNIGCEVLSGKVMVLIDPLLKFDDSSNLLEATDSTFSFVVEPLQGSGLFSYYFYVTMPDENFNMQEVEIIASFNGSEGIFRDKIRCAIDPNDKQVSPSRDFPTNYTLDDEKLTYKVRFQNTGSDTAFTVVVKDTLSTLLDVGTIAFIGTSHTGVFSVEDRVLTMAYEDIYLVDSTTNEPESHGFFEFTIETIDDIEDFTVIENTASIFFEENAPIITNTVYSTIIDEIDADNDGFYFWEECDDNDARARPDGVELPNNDVDEDCDGVVEYFTEENCNIIAEDFVNYSEGGFTNQTNGNWFLKSSESKDATIADWGDGFKVLDIASDFNQSNLDYEAQVVQKLDLQDPESISISFNYGNECGIIALELYEDSTFTRFGDFVIDGYGEDFDSPAYLIQGDSFALCHGFGFFVNYTIILDFLEDVLIVKCPDGSEITHPFYMDAANFME